MPEQKADIANTLGGLPGWSNLTAYEMAKLCCAEMTRRGIQLGGWMNIRDIIGKGSSTDINRGIKDFLQEHAQMLYDMKGIVSGVPEQLAPHILGFWKCAIEHVSKEYETKTKDQLCAHENVLSSLKNSNAERDKAIEYNNQLKGKNDAISAKCDQLSETLQNERLKHQLIERQLENANKELAEQRKALRHALEKSQTELGNALTRLEAAEQHALLEVSRVKSDYENRLAHAESKTASLRHEFTAEKQRHSQTTTKLTNKVAALEQENSSMKGRLRRAEDLVDKLLEKTNKAAGKG